MAECHPDRPHRAKGLCNSCYALQYTREHRNDPDKPYLNTKRAEYFKRWYERYPGRSHRRAQGVTREAAEQMLAEQDGRCAICGIEAPMGNGWHVDHCHITGKIRGLLCQHCNAGMGNFRDDPTILVRAIAYLQEWADRPGREFEPVKKIKSGRPRKVTP